MSSPLYLKTPTNPEWVHVVSNDFNHFLLDHAACERKAAASAMALIAKYPDRHALIEPMVCLAREELEHFQRVYKIIHKYQFRYEPMDEKDPYVNMMLKAVRPTRDEQFIDRLLVSAFIEQRGHERFGLLAAHLTDPFLKDFYEELAEREEGHGMIFIRIARVYEQEEALKKRIEEFRTIESMALAACPLRPVVH